MACRYRAFRSAKGGAAAMHGHPAAPSPLARRPLLRPTFIRPLKRQTHRNLQRAASYTPNKSPARSDIQRARYAGPGAAPAEPPQQTWPPGAMQSRRLNQNVPKKQREPTKIIPQKAPYAKPERQLSCLSSTLREQDGEPQPMGVHAIRHTIPWAAGPTLVRLRGPPSPHPPPQYHPLPDDAFRQQTWMSILTPAAGVPGLAPVRGAPRQGGRQSSSAIKGCGGGRGGGCAASPGPVCS